jgi:ferrous-iron efflux pump FieF
MAVSVDAAAVLPAETRARLMRRATGASLTVAAVFSVAKLGAVTVTDSTAMLSTLIDSLLDVVASLLTLLAVRQALVPADREHRFGHGKAESLAGLGQAVFIGGSAVFLFVQAGRRLVDPQPVSHSLVGIAVVVASMIATVLLVRYQASVVRRTGSVAVSADKLHYASDLMLNAGVILALVLGPWLGWPWIDPLLALAIGGFVLYGAWRIVLQSLDILMDRELADAERARIRAICEAHPDVLGVHEMRTRRAGADIFVQLHLVLDGALSLRRANSIAHAVEQSIQTEFPGAEVLIHEDPSSEAPEVAPWRQSGAA